MLIYEEIAFFYMNEIIKNIQNYEENMSDEIRRVLKVNQGYMRKQNHNKRG